MAFQSPLTAFSILYASCVCAVGDTGLTPNDEDRCVNAAAALNGLLNDCTYDGWLVVVTSWRKKLCKSVLHSDSAAARGRSSLYFSLLQRTVDIEPINDATLNF